MISVSENVAGAPCDSLPPLGQFSDRQAAHYYRRQYHRAVQREQQWEQRVLAAERIIAQLLVLVGGCVQQIEALKGQLAWLKKQQFGRKSETTQANGLAASPEGATEASAPTGSAEGSEQAAQAGPAGRASQTKRRRGQQRGGKGPKRRRRLHLPEETTHHTLAEAPRTCSICGKIRPESGLTEESEEIEWKVCLVRHRHVRHRYGPSCDCPQSRGILTAPKPAKPIPKSAVRGQFLGAGVVEEVRVPAAAAENGARTQGSRFGGFSSMLFRVILGAQRARLLGLESAQSVGHSAHMKAISKRELQHKHVLATPLPPVNTAAIKGASGTLMISRRKRFQLSAKEIHRELDRLCEGAPKLDCQAVLDDLRQ